MSDYKREELVRKLWIAVASAGVLSGCKNAPSIVLFGASFPDWLFCITGAVLLVALTHLSLGGIGGRERLSPLIISYPALTACFSVLLWLIFFFH